MSDWRINEGSRHPVVLTLGDVEHCMTVARAMEMLRNAPKVAGPWLLSRGSDPHPLRRDARGDLLAYAHSIGRASWWRVFDGATPRGGQCATLDEAKSAADAALREAGWVLDDGGGEHG